ncbi:MAG: hypothetical protein U1A27_00980 [Phycisphaerae bacterium]
MTLLAAPSGPSSLQWALLASLLAGVMWIVWRSWRASLGPSATGADRQARADLREQRQVIAEVERLMAELERLSQRLGREVDEHLARLRTATDAVDERLRRLAAAGETAPDAPRTPALSAPTPVTPTAPAPATSSASAPADDGSRRIFELADAGQSPIEIARQVGRSIGEIELLLNLRQVSKRAS